jgi:hypothetical protein
VLEDKDGVLTLIRIVDTLTRTAMGPDVPDEMAPFTLEGYRLVVSLKSDRARGRYSVKIRPEDPSGTQLAAVELPVHLEGGERGVNLIVDLSFPVELEGLYWFDILFVSGRGVERLLTRIPLRVRYQPQRVGSAAQ